MRQIRQKVHYVDQDHNTCMVMSGKGNIYPVDLNHYVKEINEGDTAIVTKAISGEWLLVDVEPKYPKQLDVTEFPRDENNCLAIIEYGKYLKVIEDMSESERVDFDNHLLKRFINEYGMKNTLNHRMGQLGYDTSENDVEPQTTTLEDF